MFEPFGNTTVLPPKQWHPEPLRRGTFSILSSCLITMSLCIWTSLYLNLPGHRKEHLQKYRKAGWMVIGLLAPELVVWNAWEQRKEVKKISALMQKHSFMPKNPNTWASKAWQRAKILLLLKAEDLPELQTRSWLEHRTYAWTDVHSWFLLMGGFAFEDMAREAHQFMSEGCQRTILTPRMLRQVLDTRPHTIPDVSREFIEDKSKCDWLGKVVTLWQGAYFCVLCIFRLSQHLSITLLELNVFAHALCALLLFSTWWDKPRDIQEPILMCSEEALDVCAALLVSSVQNYGRVFPTFIPSREPQPLEECLEILHPTTFHVRRKPSDRSDVVFTQGDSSHHFIKLQDSYWELAWTLSNDTAISLDSCYIKRLTRAYKAAYETFVGALSRSPEDISPTFRFGPGDSEF